jgi:exosortase
MAGTALSPPPVREQLTQKDWIPFVWFSSLLFISYCVVLYRLSQQWLADENMSHGMFVPVLAGYIAWRRRREIAIICPKPSIWGVFLMLLGGLMLCVGPPSLPTFTFLTRIAFVTSLVGVILTVRGFQTVIALMYPLCLLFFMIPLPGFIYERLTLPLQFVASAVSENVLELLGYSVLREGNILHLPGQSLSVVEACSGLRSLVALSFLAQACAFLIDRRPWMRLALAMAIIPIAVMANSGRIVFTAFMGYHRPDWVHGVYHASTAWVVFVVAFVLLLLTYWCINRIAVLLAK